MQKKMTQRLIPALMAVAFAGSASAAGFQLLEQNASGIGNSYAGSAAVAENASTIFYNPAGMTELQAREISGGISAIKTSFEFTNNGSVTPGLTGNGGDAGGWGVVPNAYLSWQVSKDVYLGLGIGAPFGLKTEYDEPWIGAAQAVSFDIKTINLNPSIAWRVNDKLSLGFGVSWQKIDAEYIRRGGINGVPGIPNGVLPNTTVKMEIDDASWGWNVGVLLKPTAQTKIGLSYRSKVKYETDGNVSVTGPSSAVNAAGSSGVKADIDVPDTFIFSLAQGIGERWELLGDISWTGWGSIPQVDIIRTSGTVAQVLETKYNDVWRYAVGANYKLNDAVKLKFGVAFDESPTPNDQNRLVSLPDNDRTWFSTGVQWKQSKTSTLDLGLAYLYVKDTNINNNQLAQGRGLVKGSYDNSAWIFGAQYSMGF
ncbi:MAG: long-chain fatty acid transporter [Betaproteobacteria bacterium HGW-Betaproteobacteria-10]|nr:MAG: long-chain fatty acid transporter [Betaproteobacteria bacterium HGW-Betaproteobacteria-10]